MQFQVFLNAINRTLFLLQQHPNLTHDVSSMLYLYTFGEYDSVERTIEFDVHSHVCFLALHLQMFDLDSVRHGLQRPCLVMRSLQRTGGQRQSDIISAAGSVFKR